MEEYESSYLVWRKERRPWYIRCMRTRCAHNELSTCAFSETATWSLSSEVLIRQVWRQPAVRLRHCRLSLWPSGVSARMIMVGASATTERIALCSQPGCSTTPANCTTPPPTATDTSSLPQCGGKPTGNRQTTGKIPHRTVIWNQGYVYGSSKMICSRFDAGGITMQNYFSVPQFPLRWFSRQNLRSLSV